ncbi:LIM domain and actin-binding protein 1-like isoform X3 [Synchiropus splendidus]|uniref:LIM domain and actin-binding protein 1-like isoform X3 n=1 Tax=Synchiropus splendidus TaxID=270530 RepID=UPI00237D641C|nr:LIM domain and actin-binding protein 1-like isoform X3 [Synchiropus splendidus]
MEAQSSLRRTQSQWSVPTSPDKPAKTDMRLPDKKASVSQLIARYQITPGGSASSQTSSGDSDAKVHKVVNEVAVERKLGGKLGESKKTKADSSTRRSEESQASSVKSSLTRSKSMGSLNNNTGSIKALRALFEPVGAVDNNWGRSFSTTHLASPAKEAKSVVVNGDESVPQKHQHHNKADVSVKNKKTLGKEEKEAEKEVKLTRRERSKTIGGIDIAKIGEDKRRLTTDFSHSFPKQNLSVSVKAISALFMSKVEQQESNLTPVKQAEEPSPQPVKKVSKVKFQPTNQETCYACLKPVYPMERISTDKFIFHKSCFCCKQCKKTLSVFNFAPLQGEYYCVFHYKQLYRRTGNSHRMTAKSRSEQ